MHPSTNRYADEQWIYDELERDYGPEAVENVKRYFQPVEIEEEIIVQPVRRPPFVWLNDLLFPPPAERHSLYARAPIGSTDVPVFAAEKYHRRLLLSEALPFLLILLGIFAAYNFGRPYYNHIDEQIDKIGNSNPNGQYGTIEDVKEGDDVRRNPFDNSEEEDSSSSNNFNTKRRGYKKGDTMEDSCEKDDLIEFRDQGSQCPQSLEKSQRSTMKTYTHNIPHNRSSIVHMGPDNEELTNEQLNRTMAVLDWQINNPTFKPGHFTQTDSDTVVAEIHHDHNQILPKAEVTTIGVATGLAMLSAEVCNTLPFFMKY